MGQNRGRYIGERIAEQQSGFYTGVGWHYLRWPSSLAAINDKIAKSIERSARRSLVTGPNMAAYLSARSAKLERIFRLKLRAAIEASSYAVVSTSVAFLGKPW